MIDSMINYYGEPEPTRPDEPRAINDELVFAARETSGICSLSLYPSLTFFLSRTRRGGGEQSENIRTNERTRDRARHLPFLPGSLNGRRDENFHLPRVGTKLYIGFRLSWLLQRSPLGFLLRHATEPRMHFAHHGVVRTRRTVQIHLLMSRVTL